MNTYPKVSILLAAYNSGTTIQENLQSILTQTYPNLQLILCDDGTEGFNGGEIEHFVQRQGSPVSFLIVHQPQNVGTVRNLNAGLKHADGEWIMILAADDLFASEQAVEHMMKQVLKHECQWAVAQTALCDEQLNFYGRSVPDGDVPDNILTGNAEGLYLQLCMGCCLPAGGSVYHAELLRELGGFDETYRLTEDWPIFLKLVRRGLMPALSEETVVLHRGGGVSRKQAGKNFAYQRDLITVLREEVAPQIDLLDELEQKMIRKLIRDKELGYEFRFSRPTWAAKLFWCAKHPGFILRKFFQRREEQC